MKKEALSAIIIKILLAILLFTGMGTIIIGGGYIIGEHYKNLTSDQITEQIDQEENYYDVLEKKCNGDGCCLASLRVMRENNYKEANENGKCPDSFNGNMMRCITSYQWCEPIREEYSDLKIYKNEELGIEFKYPSKKLKIENQYNHNDLWSLLFLPVNKDESTKHSLDSGSLIYCNNDTPEHSHLTHYKNIEEYKNFIVSIGNLKEYNSFRNNKLDWFCYTSLETIHSQLDTKTCITEKPKNNFYQISFSLKETDINNDYFSLDEFDKLIMSFKFKEQSDISDLSSKASAMNDWQTYRNEEFGFEVKYPKGWFLDGKNLSSQKIEYQDIGSNNAPINFGIYSKETDVFLNNKNIFGFGHIKYQIENSKRNSSDTKTLIDNKEFNKYDLIDYGRYEGNSAGNVVLLVSSEIIIDSNKLYLVFEWQEYPGNIPVTENNLSDFLEIVSTIKFIEK